MDLSQEELIALKDYLVIVPEISGLLATKQWGAIQSFLDSSPVLLGNPSQGLIQFMTILSDVDKSKLYQLDDNNISFLKWLGLLYQKKAQGVATYPIEFSGILSISSTEIDRILLKVDTKIQEEELTDTTLPKVIRRLFAIISQDKDQASRDVVKDLLVALLTDGLINLSTGLVFYVELNNTQKRWQSLNLGELPTTTEIETALNI